MHDDNKINHLLNRDTIIKSRIFYKHRSRISHTLKKCFCSVFLDHLVQERSEVLDRITELKLFSSLLLGEDNRDFDHSSNALR